MKQSKLRKRRVWRYAILYFVLLVLFLALVVGPIVAGKNVLTNSLIKNIPQELFQPIGQNNNDTRGRNETGTGAKATNGASATAGSGSSASTNIARAIKLY
jgi:1,3-beta-glucan synthase